MELKVNTEQRIGVPGCALRFGGVLRFFFSQSENKLINYDKFLNH